jgi:hypothetical protein
MLKGLKTSTKPCKGFCQLDKTSYLCSVWITKKRPSNWVHGP